MAAIPLPERLRPQTLDDYVGQRHLVGPGCVLRRMLDSGTITRKEFLAFENKMLQKYGLPKCSLYRDFHLLYPLDQR